MDTKKSTSSLILTLFYLVSYCNISFAGEGHCIEDYVKLLETKYKVYREKEFYKPDINEYKKYRLKRPDLILEDKRKKRVIILEVKCQREIKRGKSSWLNYKDYLKDCRDEMKKKFLGNPNPRIKSDRKTTAWMIVIGCQMGYYRQKKGKIWDFPTKDNFTQRVKDRSYAIQWGLLADIGELKEHEKYEEERAIEQAFKNLKVNIEEKIPIKEGKDVKGVIYLIPIHGLKNCDICNEGLKIHPLKSLKKLWL